MSATQTCGVDECGTEEDHGVTDPVIAKSIY